MSFTKGGVAIIALIIGLLVGSSPSVGPEIQKLVSQLRSASSSLAQTAGRGSTEVGQFVAE